MQNDQRGDAGYGELAQEGIDGMGVFNFYINKIKININTVRYLYDILFI